ncbi:MAG: MBL fold metallo-hydrolase [Bacteroidetes bacterium]|nr:MBL fold metallo-hydrolase [Bacteroidota bacterium]MCL5026852.1 MBL fold metallo-hydrolase [Chloroflexota bacterium]
MRLHSQALQIGTDWGDGGHTKLYFFEGEKKAIVDTGVNTSPEQDIAPYLDYYGYKLSDIDIILNTHGHHDHAGGNPAIPQAEIWMHEADVFLVEEPPKAFEALNAPALQLMGKSEAQISGEQTKYVSSCVRQKVTRVLKDGDVVDLGAGIQLRVVSLPGHTMGSIGYLWEKEGMFFVGDSAMGQGSRPGILPVLYYPLTYARTLQKMQEMQIGLLGLGHYYQTLRINSNPIKKGNQIPLYLQDCQEINNRIMEAMGNAIHEHWGAPFPVVMAAAVNLLSQRLSLRRDPATGLPMGAARTLGAYYIDIMNNL